MFEEDHSASRGEMNVRKLVIFKHDSELGNAASYKLFNAVKIQAKEGIDTPRKFEDYDFSIENDSVPSGVSVIVKD